MVKLHYIHHRFMPKKTTTSKVKKTSKKKAKQILMSDALDDDTMIHVVGDPDDLPIEFARMMMEKIMGQICKKLQSLDLSEEEFQTVDLMSLINSMPTPQAGGPKDKAQELVYSAYETSDPKKQVAIARKALKLDPDNVDALLIIAEQPSRRIFDTVSGYREAVQAGERSLGEDFIEEHAGYFWGMHETRPYMRALERLAANLRKVAAGGEGLESILVEAKEIYQRMLWLNPDDNQGIRYSLFYVLLELDQDDETEKLYKKYEDDYSAWWLYGRALLDYRKHGDTAKSQKSLAKAIEYNKHFPAYLLGRKKFPANPPGHYGMGDANEAAYYMDESILTWTKTPGAVDWVRKCVDKK